MRSAINKLRPLVHKLLGGNAERPSKPGALPPIDGALIGLRDAVKSGWYSNGEVFRGIPISNDDVVLDVGCGDGGTAHYCASQGAAMIVVDSDPIRLVKTKERLAGVPARSVRAIASGCNPLSLEDNVASVVISMEVLEHVDEPKQFMQELVRVGRPGASYLLTVPDPASEHLQKRVAPPSYFEKPHHIRVFERDEFADLVAGSGLLIEQRDTYGFFSSLWWLMIWACIDEINDPQHPARQNWARTGDVLQHPVLDNWARTWTYLLDTARGAEIKRLLDDCLPKSQIIVARKRGSP
jgi:SAM-dependent methyltransferase